MQPHIFVIGVVLTLCVATQADAARVQTFEEAINRVDATHAFPESPARELLYRVGFVYANRARLEPEKSWRVASKLEAMPTDVTALDFTIAATNFATGQGLAGSMDLMNWFNAGMSKGARYSYYLVNTTPLVSLPNTQYYRFDEREGTATAEDVYAAWDSAYALMAAMYPADQCHVFGWSEKTQYARTYMKNRPGSHKEILYLCPHPLFAGELVKVEVSAYANPTKGVRTVGMVQTQCWVDRKRNNWVDISACGLELAEKQRSRIPADPVAPWMQMVTTPTSADPGRMITIVRYRDRELTMEPPGLADDYAKFLRSSHLERTSGASDVASR